MANVINKAINKFGKGLVMDFSPENTGNEVLTHALNATFLTFNGNELSLQNDMGNARVETAFLPEGYIPVGTCEYGGIIYIVSYNPLEDKSQIGCFPSPERNISSDEMEIPQHFIENFDFQGNNGEIINNSKYVLLKNDNLNPGDKFIIQTDENIYEERLLNLYKNNQLIDNPILKISVVSIEESGKIIYLDSTLRQYEKSINDNVYKYHILGSDNVDNDGINKPDIDVYRNILSSGYNIFKSKTSGKLALLAELITIDSYSVTHSIIPKEGSIDEFDIIIHTEVSPMPKAMLKSRGIDPSPNDPGINEINNNYYQIPKLKYYYLKESQGTLDINPNPINLFTENNSLNNNFLNTELKDIYSNLENNDLGDVKLKDSGKFDFPMKNTYHLNLIQDNTNYGDKGIPLNLYIEFKGGNYYKIRFSQLNYIKTENPKLLNDISYYNLDLIELNVNNINDNDIIYIKFINTKYIKSNLFHANTIDNHMHYQDIIEKGDRLYVYKLNDDYLISNSQSDSNYLNYSDIKLGSIKIPNEIYDNNQPFPFKYNYTLVPCMEYGKLENLKITNTIDFSKIKNFEASDFNGWRYHIDGNQLKLTFGTEIYDSISNEKVIGLFLEFYDQFGFVGSLSVDGNKKSYSGEFTRILNLDTPNVLSKLKITDDKKSSTEYKDSRNVNIIKTETGYSYFGRSCEKINGIWSYKYQISDNFNPEQKNRALESVISPTIIENDFGILHSNLIYGVKLYFKIKNNDNIYYKDKDPRILFTFPIYNNHYYDTKDFSILQPDLKLALNYKLIDKSNRDVYSNEQHHIENGYYTQSENDQLLSDNDLIQQYIKGNYNDTNLHATKYYQYDGKTELNLEVGLKKEYENIGFWSEGLEDIFTCDLQLMGDSENNTYYYESDISNLNYKENWSNVNTLTFDKNLKNKLNTNLKNSFTINYKFVVGYNFDITDIRSTEVPATTFCALCHKKDENSDYNYGDFNIYKSNNNYYSNFIVNSSGDSTKAFLNLYQQSSIEEKTADKIKTIIDSNSTTNTDQNENNKIQTSLIKKYYNLLGKFTFCVPHSHIHDISYGNSLTADNHYANYEGFNGNYNPGKLYIARSNDKEGDYEENGTPDQTDGIIPTGCYYYNPLFTMCPITQSLITQESKFISVINSYNNTYENDPKTIMYYNFDEEKLMKPEVNYLIEFSGISNNNLVEFNKCLLETMKNVYAYNPDYDTLNIKVGDVNLQEYNVKFISNIISSNSKLKDDSIFNNYIYFYNNFNLSQYIIYLCNKLDIDESDIKDQITFKPNYTYCGTKEQFYLITNLNYNIPYPKTLVDELSFKSSGIIIKHSDGNVEMFNFNEIPNKTLLYGIDENNNLIQLNAGNYEIKDDSTLKVYNRDSENNQINYSTPPQYYFWADNLDYKIKDEYKKCCLKYSKITLSDLIYIPYSEHKLYLKDNYKYHNDPNAKVYYRKIYEEWKDAKNDWNQNTRNKNYTQMYLGPGFNE